MFKQRFLKQKKIEFKHQCYFIFEQTFCNLLIFKHWAKRNIQLILVRYLFIFIEIDIRFVFFFKNR